MKENFLNSKSKKVLLAICEILELDAKNLNKLPKIFLVEMLLKVSYRKIVNAYKSTLYGHYRERVNKALEAYPDDNAAQYNFDALNIELA